MTRDGRRIHKKQYSLKLQLIIQYLKLRSFLALIICISKLYETIDATSQRLKHFRFEKKKRNYLN